ncbi:MAG: flagellar export protein FliJ [Pseudomonadota bacterium]
MSGRLSRLAPVQRFAEQETDTAGASLAQAEQSLSHAKSTLADLIQYRAGYADTQPGGDRWQSDRWRDYCEFLQKLDAAIVQQQQAIDQAEAQRNDCLRIWQQKKTRMDALERLSGRLRQRALQEASRREQKQSDDLVASRPQRDPFAN